MRTKISLLLVLCGLTFKASAQIKYPGTEPGVSIDKHTASSFTLENNILGIGFGTTNQHLVLASFTDKASHDQLLHANNALFSLQLANGSFISSDSFVLQGAPKVSTIQADDKTLRLAGKLSGKKLTAELKNAKLGLQVKWEADLYDDANYIRQTLTFLPNDSIRVSKVILVNLPTGISAEQKGTVDGSPLVHNNMFFALEHPMSQVQKSKSGYRIFLPRLQAISARRPLTVSSVWGVTPAGQLRRGFLYYVERERAVPYRQQLHYNSWFDISWQDRKLNDSVCLDRIKVFKDSLIDKRDTRLKAFLFDDGWDDNKTLWQFNAGFPQGFSNLSRATSEAHAGLGVWISPWGGYDKPKEQRLEFGKKQDPPFETNDNGFSLTGPVYFKRFSTVATDFIKKYGISVFKFDGMGAGNGASGASITYQKDIEAFLKLMTDLREQEPSIYLSLTVGTWPSVYWLKYGDCIWRAGDDTGLGGTGNKRQQWITYRDQQVYQNIVKRAPLYPLNSVMYHGICIADNGLPGKLEMDDKDISDEIWEFFGNGTSLQELYVNPHKLNANNWNCLRDAAKWSQANAAALADIHWIGGDPAKGEVYGFAGWNKGGGVLTLRNPSASIKTYVVNVRHDLDLPSTETAVYQFYDARKTSAKASYSGEHFIVTLKPYETRVMNAR
jgi:hypothetical protein